MAVVGAYAGPAPCIAMASQCAFLLDTDRLGAGTEDQDDRRALVDASHPVQRAWIAEEVPQCGYCQSGQIMQAASLLASNPTPD